VVSPFFGGGLPLITRPRVHFEKCVVLHGFFTAEKGEKMQTEEWEDSARIEIVPKFFKTTCGNFETHRRTGLVANPLQQVDPSDKKHDGKNNSAPDANGYLRPEENELILILFLLKL
jgi:hypothetical protein